MSSFFFFFFVLNWPQEKNGCSALIKSEVLFQSVKMVISTPPCLVLPIDSHSWPHPLHTPNLEFSVLEMLRILHYENSPPSTSLIQY